MGFVKRLISMPARTLVLAALFSQSALYPQESFPRLPQFPLWVCSAIR